MKRNFLLIIILLAAVPIFAQPGKKTTTKEKPPTQKEMEDMMKEAQKAMDEMSPEDKKMMDSMGIKMPSFKNAPKVTDKQLADAWEDENRIVPKKNTAKIAAIPGTALTNPSLPGYLQSSTAKILSQYEAAEKQAAEEAYTYLKTKFGNNSNAIANTAIALWMMKKYKAAIYILAKLCAANPTDASLLCNFASLITMAGAEDIAVPLLNYLNTNYPNNSTILNNLAHAWFGLGDMDKAKTYSDKTLMLCAWHPQANHIKSLIAEEKGDRSGAVAAEKAAIKKYYSAEKEEHLRKLGYKLDGDDVNFPFKPDPDPLGLASFVHPPFPVNAEQELSAKETWKSFRDGIDNRMAALQRQLKDAEESWQKKLQQIQAHDMKVVKTSMAAGMPTGNLITVPVYARKASLKLKNLDKDGGVNYRYEKAIKDVALYPVNMVPLHDAYEKEMARLAEEDLEQTGEGKPNKDYCPKYLAEITKYLAAYNADYERLQDEWLHQYRQKISEELFWYQYIQWPEEFAVTKLSFQIGWLGALRDMHYEETSYSRLESCVRAKENDKGKKGKLANFNDINCKYKSEFDWVVLKMKQECDKVTTEFKADIFGLKIFEAELKQDYGQVLKYQDGWDVFTGSIVKCTIAAGISEDVGISHGPLHLDAEAGIDGVIEIGRDGITDIGIKVSGEVSAGYNNVPVKFVESEVKLMVNSGFSTEAKILNQNIGGGKN